ncbi:hypothetical protein LSH36_242g05024 [Paralvinella palmiformis]|uniref:Reelin domain-containing protein n=1 Tax=Paralvinella palmiformis TaxID=53620 RepID=A0AAD9N3G9_9ANNE|nr:hypothetical protein LSH36_242g05024 [Paralvinella palmiformis]
MASFLWALACLAGALLPLAMCSPANPPSNESVGSSCVLGNLSRLTDLPMEKGCPFKVVPAGECYKSDDEVAVFVRMNATEANQPKLEQFFVVATVNRFRERNASPIVGSFDVRYDLLLKTVSCFNESNSIVAQFSGTRRKCVRFFWRAPENLTEDIVFELTVVVNSTFVVNVRSDLVLSYNVNCSSNNALVDCKQSVNSKVIFSTGGCETVYVGIGVWTTLLTVIFQLLKL